MLMVGDENDPLAKARIFAFTQALADLGWTEGRNARMAAIVGLTLGRSCSPSKARTIDRPNEF
jgi:hypothetical protein